MGLRKNSSAKSWVKKRIGYLVKEGNTRGMALAAALEQANSHKLFRNPAELDELRDELSDAEEVARGFHGRELQESFEEVEHHQYRAELAQLGELIELEVYNPNLVDLLELAFDNSNESSLVRVAGSGDRKQLFLIGGDTEIDNDLIETLSPFGSEKDRVRLGHVYSISYFTDKHHLVGPKSQAKGSEYGHCFGSATFKNPREGKNGAMDDEVFAVIEKLEAGLLPELIYDRLNQSLDLIGGGYEIRDEGIWN